MRSPQDLASGFDAAKSAWGGENIWRSMNRFTDGASDGDPRPGLSSTGTLNAPIPSASDSRYQTLRDDGMNPVRSGSAVLIPSSEFEPRTSQSASPWGQPAMSDASLVPRPPAPSTSMNRRRNLDTQVFSQGTQDTAPGLRISKPNKDWSQRPDQASLSLASSRSALSNISPRASRFNSFVDFRPSHVDEQMAHKPESKLMGLGAGPNFTRSKLRQDYSKPDLGDSEDHPPFYNPRLRSSYAGLRATYEAGPEDSMFHIMSKAVAREFSDDLGEVSRPPNFSFPNNSKAAELQDYPAGRLSTMLGHMSIDDDDTYTSHPLSRLRTGEQPSIEGVDTFGSYQRGFIPQRSVHQVAEQILPTESAHRPYPFDDFDGQGTLPTRRQPSIGDRGTISPTTSDFNRNLQSPSYSTNGTATSGLDSGRSTSAGGVSSRTSNTPLAHFDRNIRNANASHLDSRFLHPVQSQLHYPPAYDFTPYVPPVRFNQFASPYAMPGFVHFHGVSHIPRHHSREYDPNQILRSPLLEDFRMNHKTNKRYELKDIYNHVVEFSGDQHGSRFIQQKLETANSDEKDQVFSEIQPNALQLMTDVFGNYVVQKVFEHGNQSQKRILAHQMKGHVLSLSTQMYGCRVVQKALEHVLTDQQASMVKELESHVIKCVRDQNGNHVIQKAIERVPAEYIQFIVDAFKDQVARLATHPYGCRVIQRMLEHCEPAAKQSILKELHTCVPSLITDQFGNYVIQHVIENGQAQDRHRVVEVVQSQLLDFSKHKFASNVVEKAIEFAEDEQRAAILQQLTAMNERGESPVLGLMRDQYGNYVIRKSKPPRLTHELTARPEKVLNQLRGLEREMLVQQIRAQLVQLKKFSYGKQVNAIEKLIADEPDRSSFSASSQSSALPSTNASTIEENIRASPPQPAKRPRPHDTQIAVPLAPPTSHTPIANQTEPTPD